MRYAVTIDVPELAAGLKFYRDGLGLAEISRPVPGYVVLRCGDGTIGLMEKQAGSLPAAGANDVRRYERHWTPVHVDFHVEDFDGALAMALKAGARCEQKFEGGKHPPVAFCSDPFGHGFCIIGMKAGG
ncbi:MAG TPA: VOC family protein [Rhizomicrobium sp.]|jgi:catechol 2,3-dioxygenase-like lactoylglutathione lyase family enzyme|nr:VOC family protein [Rhizomicrobium sp.]